MSELLALLKQNLVLSHEEDDALLIHFLKAASAYACGFQHLPANYYDTHPMGKVTEQGILLLATHLYESRDASSAGFFQNQPAAAKQTWEAIHRLLIVDRDWKV